MSDVVVLGKLTSPYAIRGWLRLQPFGDDPWTWEEMSQWWVSPQPQAPLEQWRALELEALEPHARGWIVKFVGIDDRTAAESLRGWYFGAPREALPEPDEDEYYWGDLIGCRVLTPGGEPLGTVRELIAGGAHDVLVVVEGDKERLIPFVAAIVPEVDLAARRIVSNWSPDW